MQKCVNILTPKLLPTILCLLHALQLGVPGGTHLLQRLLVMAVHIAASGARLKSLIINNALRIKVQRGPSLINVFLFTVPLILKMQEHRQQLLISSSLATSPDFLK